MTKISIMGCGWLGTPLALRLQQSDYQVKGSTTNLETERILKNCGIYVSRLRFDPRPNQPIEDFFESDYTIINIPPKRKVQSEEHYIRILQEVITCIPSTCRVIFISSTGVYDNTNQAASEGNANLNSFLYKSEEIIHNAAFSSIVLRCAGLVGPDRWIVNMLAKRYEEVPGGDTPVNLVYLDDVIDAVLTIVTHDSFFSGTYNICCDAHPTKSQVYGSWGKELGYSLKFAPETTGHKVVQNTLFKDSFDFTYGNPDPMKFLIGKKSE